MTTRYTAHYQFPVPDFLSAPWHAQIQLAFDRIDAAIYDPTAVVGDDERLYWKNKAALLDPRALTYYTPPFDVTVPVGEVWFVTDAFFIESLLYNGSVAANSAGSYAHWDHRDPHYENAIAIGAGTRLTQFAHDGFGASGALTICKPSVVWALDARYEADARALYYARLAKFNELEVRRTWTRIAEGSAVATTIEETMDWTGATDALWGIGRHVSTSDAAWVFIGGTAANDVTFLSCSLTNEITDTHGHRLGGIRIFPFVRKSAGVAGFNKIKLHAGNLSGDPADLSGADTANRHAYGVFSWSAIRPSDNW